MWNFSFPLFTNSNIWRLTPLRPLLSVSDSPFNAATAKDVMMTFVQNKRWAYSGIVAMLHLRIIGIFSNVINFHSSVCFYTMLGRKFGKKLEYCQWSQCPATNSTDCPALPRLCRRPKILYTSILQTSCPRPFFEEQPEAAGSAGVSLPPKGICSLLSESFFIFVWHFFARG